MKKTKIAYWIVTGLFAAFMIFSSVSNVIKSKEAVDLITKMGYPIYIIPFLGVAKIIASIVILIPGFPRLKEWAYAGIVIDLVGATYSFIALGYPTGSWIFMFVFIGFAFLSYGLYHKMMREKAMAGR